MYDSKLHLNFLSLIFTITECISIAAFASLVDIYTEIMSTEIMSSTTGLNICAIVTRIKESKSLIKKKKKKHNEIVLLARSLYLTHILDTITFFF